MNLQLSEGILYDPTVDRLILNHSPFLFLKLPLFCDDSWVDADLNYLLFKKKISPILTSFEGNIHTNDPKHIDQMVSSKAYRISLDLNYVTAIDSQARLGQIISREIPIFPSISHELSNYVGILQAFSDWKERIGSSVYTRFSSNLLRQERIFFSHHYYYTK